MSQENIIVIGNGMVGYKFCERLTDADTNNEFKISTFCEEGRPAYDRVHLSAYFDGKTAEDLSMAAESWYTERNIDLFIGDKAISIDRENKTVTSEQGKTLPYDKLVLATGSSAFVPPVPGVEKEGVFVYRTIEDLEDITAYAKKSKTCAVIGGGLLGLEAAKAAQDLGLKTHVIEFAPRLMPRQVDDAGGEMLKQLIESLDIKCHLNKATKNIAGEGAVSAMEFSDDTSLDVDMIIVSAGIRPRDEIAKQADLVIGPRGGILVNEALQTSDEDIFAIGECALYDNMIYGLVAPGYTMADTVAKNLLGGEQQFTGADMSTKLKLLGTDVASFGQIEEVAGESRGISINDPHAGVYQKLVVSEDGKLLLGGVLVGDADKYGQLLQIYQNEMPLPENPLSLILPAGSGEESAGSGVDALPDTASICSCEAVTKGQLCGAIAEGNDTIPKLKSCTKAGTGCGGCVPMMTDVLNNELKKAGQEVNNDLCEHFSYSRSEMYNLIRVSKIKTFDEFLGRYGTGQGCEVCKPTVGSIISSAWNDPILDHAQLQDTNDAFLANIQQDGTYSIIPRVPGGEITPDKLILLGEVARDYNLYLKITGGQRIDLLGARVDQLPEIWKILVAAGFESGHAYGKSLRTVKSCVGSTWCRFGVQDSTSLAILVEERYRGLRSPHKLKGAVSGCTRECAEAQSKDFGIIATEKGWNLYVCGNGGIKPRHADLLASDLDEETLIKYIDRFLMYYIKTAERLTRTSTWMDKLEGGLQHLKDVVINDSLGINAELEEQMQHVVNTYECEWKNVIEDPEKVKRFTHFTNSDDTDETIEFTEQRTQIRPVTNEEKEAAKASETLSV